MLAMVVGYHEGGPMADIQGGSSACKYVTIFVINCALIRIDLPQKLWTARYWDQRKLVGCSLQKESPYYDRECIGKGMMAQSAIPIGVLNQHPPYAQRSPLFCSSGGPVLVGVPSI